MILIKKSHLYLTFILTCTLLMLLGIIDFIPMSRSLVPEAMQAKYHAENIFFISIISVIVVAVVYFVLMRKSVRVFRELDKVTQLSRQGRYFSEDYMHRLGGLGERIENLYFEINRLNEAKSLKISALSGVNRFLLEHCELRLCVTDIQGVIQHCSKKFATSLKLGMNDIQGRNIIDIVSDITFEELMREIERKREGVGAGKNRFKLGEAYFDGVLEIFPVVNANNALELVICTAEKEGILDEIVLKSDAMKDQVPQVGKRIKNALKIRKKN
jgi:hypothetical protein